MERRETKTSGETERKVEWRIACRKRDRGEGETEKSVWKREKQTGVETE